MNHVVFTEFFFSKARIRSLATTPNSPREIAVGVVMPRAMNPDIASKSKARQTRCTLFRRDAGFADERRPRRRLAPYKFLGIGGRQAEDPAAALLEARDHVGGLHDLGHFRAQPLQYRRRKVAPREDAKPGFE